MLACSSIVHSSPDHSSIVHSLTSHSSQARGCSSPVHSSSVALCLLTCVAARSWSNHGPSRNRYGSHTQPCSSFTALLCGRGCYMLLQVYCASFMLLQVYCASFDIYCSTVCGIASPPLGPSGSPPNLHEVSKPMTPQYAMLTACVPLPNVTSHMHLRGSGGYPTCSTRPTASSPG